MNDESTRLQAVAKTTDLAPGEARQVRVGARVLALYNIGGTYYATDDTCTHAFASLAEGFIDGDVVECPLHQGCFHIPSGKALGAPVTQNIRTYPVTVVGDRIHIALPSE